MRDENAVISWRPINERRERIAAMMLQGMQSENPTMGLPPQLLAEWAVKMADALMRAIDDYEEK